MNEHEPYRGLTDPKSALLKAPERFVVELRTTKGSMFVDVQRAWAPLGADRWFNLVNLGFYDDVAFFRVVPGFVAQAGHHGDPNINKLWQKATIKDDPVLTPNAQGTVSFASAGKHTRATQFFINLGDNRRLDALGFAPFGSVRDLEVARTLCGEYGDGPPAGRGPLPGRVAREGNKYLRSEFARLDYILSARVVDR